MLSTLIKYVFRCCLVLPLVLVVAPGLADECTIEPKPYQAEYLVSRKGKPVGSMQVTLQAVAADRFLYRMETLVDRGMIHPHIVQQSEFNWKNGIALPVAFRSDQKIAFFKRSESVEFNWDTNKASGRKKHDDFELDIQPGMQDKLTIYMLLARDTCRGLFPINAGVVSGPVLNSYNYQLRGREILKTRLGTLQTLHIRRGTPDSEKQTDLWHAAETHYLPVKIVYRKKKDINTMTLIEISFSDGSD